jgi:hypothetical protein
MIQLVTIYLAILDIPACSLNRSRIMPRLLVNSYALTARFTIEQVAIAASSDVITRSMMQNASYQVKAMDTDFLCLLK